MAVYVPETERVRYPEVYLSGLNRLSISSGSEDRSTLSSASSTASSIASPSPARGDEEAVYVAVGKEVKEAELAISWTLHNCGGRRIVILHVHQPAQKIPMMGASMPIGRVESYRVRAFHEAEREDMQKILDKYMLMCKRAGVQAEKLYIEMHSIEKGIVELISLHNIKKLVMGAAAKGHYSKKLLEPRSKKAIYVHQQAHAFCQIRFVCKGHLIHTRESKPISVNVEAVPSLQSSPSTEIVSSHLRSRSVTEGVNDQVRSLDSAIDYRRVMSDSHGTMLAGFSPYDITGSIIPHSSRSNSERSTMLAGFSPYDITGPTHSSRSNSERSTGVLEKISQRCPSGTSYYSSASFNDMVEDPASTSMASIAGNENELEGEVLPHYHKDGTNTSFHPQEPEGIMNSELYDRLQHYVEEAEVSRREAFEESMMRRKAEREAIEARFRAKASESKYVEEFKHSKEVQEALAKHKQELEEINYQVAEIQKKFQTSMEQKFSLETQIETSEKLIQDLEQKMFSAVELMTKYKTERDDLQIERDNAVMEAEELRNNHADEGSIASVYCFFSEYFFPEIEQATRGFDPALKIGEGGYGSIYKGLLRHTQVAIKMLHQHSEQGPLEYHQEVNILSKIRHPNLVTLIGACPEAWALIYEYLPNGSLEDRLNCKDNTPPLSWQTRIRIASELCSVLIFLHCCSPKSIVHGDLKPSNILLDANYVSKLSDFGICRVLNEDERSENNTSPCHRTDPKGTFAYLDPEFIATGELTPMSDVYSFGIILLRLLTGKPAFGIVKEVQTALKNESLNNILDPAAGDWPFVQAQQLANLAMSCCEMSRRNRPELSSEVWRVLEPMRASCGASSSRLIPEEHSQIPAYFICPIFQEVMQDPVVAADGYTYEGEAIRGWLDSGHETSPMTNLSLAHNNLVPNHALRSAIQEWLQQPC